MSPGPNTEATSVEAATHHSSYVGNDRRSTVSAASDFGVPLIVASLSVLVAAGAGGLLIATEPGAPNDRLVLAIVLATAGAAVSIAGSLLCFARFKLSKERISLATGVILLLAGAGWLLPARIGPMLRAEWREEVGGFAVGSAAMMAAIVVSVAFLPNIDSRLTVARHVIWAAAGVAALGLVIAIGSPDTVAATGLSGPALGQVVAGPILGMTAAALLLLGYRRRRGILAFVGLGLLGLEGAELLAIKALAIDDGWWLASSLVGFASAGVALYGVMVEYRQAHELAQTKLFESWAEREFVARGAERERERREETFHDLRAGLLGVEAVALSGALRSAATEGVLSQELARLRKLTLSSPGVPEALDLVPFVESIVELRLRQGEAVTLDAPTELFIVASPNEIAEVLFNLLDNAARHAPRSPVVVAIRSVDGQISFDVRDRGPGIPKKLLPKVFDRGITAHEGGSGLGLYISKEIVGRLGGTLEVENRVGGGCKFSFTLPHQELGSEPATVADPVDRTASPAETPRRSRVGLTGRGPDAQVSVAGTSADAGPPTPSDEPPLRSSDGWTRLHPETDATDGAAAEVEPTPAPEAGPASTRGWTRLHSPSKTITSLDVADSHPESADDDPPTQTGHEWTRMREESG